MSDTLATDTSTTDTATLVDMHLAAYCEPDAERRAELVARVWAPDGELLDPPLAASGRDELVAITDVVLTHYPDHRFRSVPLGRDPDPTLWFRILGRVLEQVRDHLL